jgi:hypothetical protein
MWLQVLSQWCAQTNLRLLVWASANGRADLYSQLLILLHILSLLSQKVLRPSTLDVGSCRLS